MLTVSSVSRFAYRVLVKLPLGRAMAQAVSRRPLTTEARVRSLVKSM
jgi:hypothetical protein